jgi:hypothetical protein
VLGNEGHDCAAPCLDVGSVLLFDYRLKHYGQGNRSDHARPVLYLTYAQPPIPSTVRRHASRRMPSFARAQHGMAPCLRSVRPRRRLLSVPEYVSAQSVHEGLRARAATPSPISPTI